MAAVTRLSADLVEFAESGVSMLVSGRDAALQPCALRAVGLRVTDEGAGLRIYVPEALSERLCSCLSDNRKVALTLSRPVDHRSVQIKGEVKEILPPEEADRLFQERYLAGFVEQLYCVGLLAR